MHRRGLLVVPFAIAACSRASAPPQSLGASSASASASSAPSLSPTVGDEPILPVYPLDAGPPDARVEALCKAFHELPESRRAACCKSAPFAGFASECKRNLGAAFAAGAITIDQADVDRCVNAIEKAYDGCDWVGANTPPTPSACLGIVHGTRAEHAKCRSSLECVAGLRCHGVGPTDVGTCGLPHADGGACRFGADVLATYAMQPDADPSHRQCTGYCDGRRCGALVAIGGACISSDACGPVAACVGKKCVAAPAGQSGEPCPTGACLEGARCVAGVCVAPKSSGAACENDLECMGGCVKADAAAKAGVCGMRCDRR